MYFGAENFNIALNKQKEKKKEKERKKEKLALF